MPSVITQTAEEWAGMTAAQIAAFGTGVVQGDYLLESDTQFVKVWVEDDVDYDDTAYTFQPYLASERAPMVQYRGSVSPSGDPDTAYWAGMTAATMDTIGVEPFDVLYEIDTGQWKVWDGLSAFDDLEYVTQTNAAVDYLLNVYGKVSIINMALGRVGAAPIQSVEDNKPGAKIALQFYRITVAEVMAAYDWTSAIARKVLNAVDEEDADYQNLTQFAMQYRVPSSPRPVRALHLFTNDYGAYQRSDTPFRIEGDYLYTDLENAGLVYIGDYSANTSKLDPFVVELIVLRLAARICFSITSSPHMTQMLMAEYDRKMAEAQFADASRSRESTNLDVFPGPERSWSANGEDEIWGRY